MVSTKKVLLVIMLVALLAVSLVVATSCKPDEEPEPLSALKFSPNSIQLYAGNSAIAQLQGLADGEKVVSWVSNDTDVATVSDAGEITAVGVGSTTVKATTNNDRFALVSISVKDNNNQLIPAITFNSTSLTLPVYDQFQLQPQLTFDGVAVDGTFTWQSTNTDVATVTNGSINAVGVGSATILCQATYNGQSVTSKVYVSVAESGYYFCADYQNKQIWQGDTFELTLSQTIGDQTTQIENVTFKSETVRVADVVNGNTFKAISGGDATITATFEHNGVTYKCKTVVHVYGEYSVSVYALGKRDHTIRGVMYGEKVTLELNKPVKNRAIKCWYVDGERIEGNSFTMLDKNVDVTAKYVNETEGDFTKYLTEGNLLKNPAEATFNKEVKKDKNGETNTDGNYVTLTNAVDGGSSVQLNLDEGIVITEDAYFTMCIYVPAITKLYLGTGNTVRRTYGATDADFIIDTGCWTEIQVPLTVFGAVDSLLNNISIGLTGSYVYIDYVMFVY